MVVTESSPPRPVTRRGRLPRRWWRPALGIATACLALALLLARYGARGESVEPRIVGSDSVADLAAVGMCALNRATGLLEGRIVAVAALAAHDAPHYQVRSLSNPAAEYVWAPTAVQVVRCP